jgi:hypothetical protein
MRSTQDAPIWMVSINCSNFFAFEVFLGDRSAHGCTIENISTSEHRDGVSETRDSALANVSGKYLRNGDEYAPSDSNAPSAPAGKALSAN